jgi:hypothetical protein
MKELGLEIQNCEKRIAQLSNAVVQRFEMRDVECIDVLNAPAAGRKQRVRIDTQEVVRELPMAEHERQTEIFPVSERPTA